jgi:hypothetical protein
MSQILDLAEASNSRVVQLVDDEDEGVEFNATNPRMVIPSSGMPLQYLAFFIQTEPEEQTFNL